MAKKLLNLQLNYKGKFLDNIRHERDFTNAFFVGNYKHLFWQINDKDFPKKHKFIEKSGSKFKLNLGENMDVKVNKEGKILSKDELTKQNLLSGNKLILEVGTEGEVSFANDWSISYYFKEPYQFVASQEHVAIHKQYAKPSRMTDEDKFTRIFIILGLVITFIGLIIGEMTYEPPEEITFTERYEMVQQQTATEVQTDVIPEIVEQVEQTVTRKSETEEEAQQVVEEAAEMTSAEFEAEFGLEFGGLDGGEGEESFAGELLEVTQVGEIVAAGPSTGSGSNSRANTGAGDLDLATGGGFDLSTAGDGLGGLGGLDGLDLGGSGGFEEVDMASLGGDVGNFQTTKVTSKAQFQEIKKKYAGIKMVKEGSIKLEEQTPEMKTELANISQIVNTYKPQITKLFTVESMIMDMYGTIEFNIIISGGGKVEAVEIQVTDGSYFTDTFIEKAKNIIMKWNVKVKDPVGYSFRLQFLK